MSTETADPQTDPTTGHEGPVEGEITTDEPQQEQAAPEPPAPTVHELGNRLLILTALKDEFSAQIGEVKAQLMEHGKQAAANGGKLSFPAREHDQAPRLANIGASHSNDAFVVTDEAAFKQWAVMNAPDLVETVTQVPTATKTALLNKPRTNEDGQAIYANEDTGEVSVIGGVEFKAGGTVIGVSVGQKDREAIADFVLRFIRNDPQGLRALAAGEADQ